LDDHFFYYFFIQSFRFDGKGEWELFNLKRDPCELNDLGQQYPEKRRNLIALYEQYKVDNGVLDISMDLSGEN